MDSAHTEPEPDPLDPNLTDFEEINSQDKECISYVNIEAYSIAKCTQRKLKELTYAKRDERKQMTDKLLKRVSQAVDRLINYQSDQMGCSLFARQAAHVAQSILMFEQYKLESADTDLNKKIK